MRHVFVETNWVVDYAAPVHRRLPAAIELLERARAGELILHLPSVCIVEAKRKIRSFQPRQTADEFRSYVRWAYSEKQLSEADREVVLITLDKLEARVSSDLKNLDDTLTSLRGEKGLDIFPLDERQLTHSLELSFGRNLNPFDQAVLAAVLGRADDILAKDGIADLSFCEKDSDLQPWDSKRNPRKELCDLYDPRRIWVYNDFDMTTPERPKDWPK